ncbi:venom metalloproteinase 3-like [Chelonus insularis]|uniref:venom metalloproteinase 3-like n=1 Tax=Chelonus insularis TaxID=460826 RepID=UPI00158E7D5E|nr:venom metalloproteinase 3-like [Chelonus insularis]
MAAFKVAKIILGLVFLGVVGSVLSQETPEQLSREEIVGMFPLAAEHEYEIVPIHKSRLQKRALNGGFHLTLTAFGENIKLWLNPQEGTLASYQTRVWLLRNRDQLIEQPNYMRQIIPRMYQDHASAATLYIDNLKQGAIQLYGAIGNNQYYVQPFPNGNYRRYPRSADNNTEAFPDHQYHIVYKVPDGRQYLNKLLNPLQNLWNNQPNKYSQINTVYPEIMVVIDYPLFQKMNYSLDFAVRYTLAFFNAVDLKYRSFDTPKYRLNVAGIIVAADPEALPYAQEVYYNTKPALLNADVLLQQSEPWMGWLGQMIGHDSFDTAITLTSRTLCVNKPGGCFPGSIGYANVGLYCKPFRAPNDPNRLWRRGHGVVYDFADFEGIRTTAHELGHLFGVNHDGDNWKNQNCDANKGHIMTPSVKFTDNGSEWSYCSLTEFQEYLNNKEPTCLFNQPKGTGDKISRFLPGQMMDANQQCFHYVGTRAHVINESICRSLACVDPNRPGYYIQSFEAAEGTRCGPKSICLHSKCVPLASIQ